MAPSKLGSIAFAATLLSGCALATVYEVLAVETGGRLGRVPYRDCRNDGTARHPETRYAYVSFSRGNRQDRRIVPIATQQTLKPGDLVYVKINACDAPVFPRTE